MTKTPLEAAESRFRTVALTDKRNRYSAFRQILKERERVLRTTQKTARLQKRTALRNPA